MLLEELETLQALLQLGTMSQVSSKLFISPSAVSKRIDKLEKSLKQQLIVRNGRRVTLTPYALNLLNQLSPALNHIQTTLSELTPDTDDSIIEISCGESLLVSYLAPLFAQIIKQDPHIRISTQHTPVTIEAVQSGKAHLGINTGISSDYPNLIFEHIRDEPFYLYPVDPLERSNNDQLIQQVICIDLNFPSNRHLKADLAQCGLHPIMQMESYMAIIESAKAGIAPAVIPECLANHYQLKPEYRQVLTISRSFYLCYQKHILNRQRFQNILKQVKQVLQCVP